jgi:hypothetical protein
VQAAVIRPSGEVATVIRKETAPDVAIIHHFGVEHLQRDGKRWAGDVACQSLVQHWVTKGAQPQSDVRGLATRNALYMHLTLHPSCREMRFMGLVCTSSLLHFFMLHVLRSSSEPTTSLEPHGVKAQVGTPWLQGTCIASGKSDRGGLRPKRIWRVWSLAPRFGKIHLSSIHTHLQRSHHLPRGSVPHDNLSVLAGGYHQLVVGGKLHTGNNGLVLVQRLQSPESVFLSQSHGILLPIIPALRTEKGGLVFSPKLPRIKLHI